MNIAELKGLNLFDYDYAIKLIIFFAIEDDLNNEDLKEYRKDFIKPQKDAVETTMSKLDELKIDYSSEIILAEQQLIKIVNNFCKFWSSNEYSLEECIDDNRLIDEPILYLMVMSAYRYGSGLWEHIHELGFYPGTEEAIYCPFLVDKILEKYNENKSR
jgi:hypothetical protein